MSSSKNSNRPGSRSTIADKGDNSSPTALADGTDFDLTSTDLTATLGAFSTRIQRKKKEQLQQTNIVEQEKKARHSLMLEALMNIRKSLGDVARIDLGERFSFSLEIDDWQGWPRLIIKLFDTLLPEAEYQSFLVQAHDRNGRGVLELAYSTPDKSERISITSESDLLILPAVLKKCVRSYLDHVAEIILGCERTTQEELEKDAQHLKSKNAGDFEEKHSAPTEISGDVYEEDLFDTAVLDSLPSMKELESLPEVFGRTDSESKKSEDAHCFLSGGVIGKE